MQWPGEKNLQNDALARNDQIRVEVEREDDGRWLAEVPALSGALAYGQSREEAVAKVEALALRILAERLEHGEPTPDLGRIPRRSGLQPKDL